MNQELKRNIKLGLIVLSFVLIFFSGYYLKTISYEMDVICRDCVSNFCMDNDIICGDFGVYYWKGFSLILMGGIGVMINIISLWEIKK
jgi:hypothetical protein